MFEAVTGELVDPPIATRFYPSVAAGALVWAEWRRPSHLELVKEWPSRASPASEELARGWWQPTIDLLRQERRRAASLERSRHAWLGEPRPEPVVTLPNDGHVADHQNREITFYAH